MTAAGRRRLPTRNELRDMCVNISSPEPQSRRAKQVQGRGVHTVPRPWACRRAQAARQGTPGSELVRNYVVHQQGDCGSGGSEPGAGAGWSQQLSRLMASILLVPAVNRRAHPLLGSSA